MKTREQGNSWAGGTLGGFIACSYDCSKTYRKEGSPIRMTEKTGETVRESGEFRCEKCSQTVSLGRGTLIPRCPQCGFDTFDLRNPRFATIEQAADERSRTRDT
jgi:Zn finger protein HypA/HybF involved in hydrogenase expression